MAVSVLISSAVIGYATDNANNTKLSGSDDYRAAAQTMEEAGMIGISAAAAVAHDPALNGVVLADSNGLSPTQLTAQAITKAQEQRQAEETAARELANTSATEAARAALLAEYDGAKVTEELNVRSAPDGEVIRIIDSGKVVCLEDAENGWYKVSFDDTTGYIKATYAELVHYADYEGTDATNWEEPVEEEPVSSGGSSYVARTVYTGNISATSDLRQAIVAQAYTYLGTPYVYGGSSYSGTDCSGLTMAVFGAFGYGLPHGASSQYYMSADVSLAEATAGDLIFFNTEGGISHVGIYLGGGSFIHASCSYGVTIDSLSGYYANCYVGVGRILP